MADFWQPQKNERKTEIDQILTPACCPRHIEHTDIKNVACNHVTAILKRYQKGQNFILLLLSLHHTFYFRAISQEVLQIQT